MLTVQRWITSDGSYPTRASSTELSSEIKDKAHLLVNAVNALLTEINWSGHSTISSGFRPSGVNSGIKHAAKASAHMSGEAVDLLDDKDQSLAKAITEELLEKYDLYMESPAHTKGKWTNWVHLQTRKIKSGNRVFIP